MKRYGQPQVIFTDKKRAAGSTTGPRTRTCHFDDASGLRSAFDGCDVYRNSSPSTLPFTIISIRNAPYAAEIISSSIEPPLLLGGASFVPHRFTLAAAN